MIFGEVFYTLSYKPIFRRRPKGGGELTSALPVFHLEI